MICFACSAQLVSIGSASLGNAIVNPIALPPTFIRAGTNAANSAAITVSAFDCSGGNYMIACSVNPSGSRTFTSMTANGSNMTLLYSTNVSSAGTMVVYGLASPTTGDVVATWSGATLNNGLSVMLFNNVVGAPGNLTADFSSSNRLGTTNSVTSLISDLVVDGTYSYAQASYVAGGSQVCIAWKNSSGCATHTDVAGTAGSTSMSGTSANNTPKTWIGLTLHGQ